MHDVSENVIGRDGDRSPGRQRKPGAPAPGWMVVEIDLDLVAPSLAEFKTQRQRRVVCKGVTLREDEICAWVVEPKLEEFLKLRRGHPALPAWIPEQEDVARHRDPSLQPVPVGEACHSSPDPSIGSIPRRKGRASSDSRPDWALQVGTCPQPRSGV